MQKSIASPFLNYHWFQNEVRIQQLKSDSFVVHASAYGCPDKKSLIFKLGLSNVGVWPIKNVRVTIQKTLSTFDPDHHGKTLKFTFDKKDIDPAPPLAISIDDKGENILIQLKDPLMPMPYDLDLANFRIQNVPSDTVYVLPDMESLVPFVWASSDVSSFEVFWGFSIDCRSFDQIRLAPQTR